MKRIFLLSLGVIFFLSVSSAIACNCGRKGNTSNPPSACQCSGSCGQSACTDSSLQGGTSENKQTESKALEVGNKICPIEGSKIGSMGEGAKFKYEGRIYNLCCAGCIQPFERNPEKYHKIADKEVGLKDENKEDQ